MTRNEQRDAARRSRHNWRRMAPVTVTGVCALAAVVAVSVSLHTTPKATRTVSIEPGRPSPPFVTVRVGSRVAWRNATHTPVRLDPAPVSVSMRHQLGVGPEASSSITFHHPGIYVYALRPWTRWTVSDYSHTSVQGPLGLPNPLKGSPRYPEPGFGAVAVIGRDPTSPAHVNVALPWNYFDPAYVVIRTGGSVTWHSLSQRPMTATSGPGAPSAFNLPVAPHAYGTHTFTKPGMYVYYSRTYVSWDHGTGLPIPAKDSDIYPIAQVGIVVVEPS